MFNRSATWNVGVPLGMSGIRNSGRPSIMLDEERQRWVRACLAQAGIGLDTCSFGSLVRDIEAAMSLFVASGPKLTGRQQHDALRDLWVLAHRADPPIGLIRYRIAQLQAEVMNRIDARAWRIIPAIEQRNPCLSSHGEEHWPVDLEAWRSAGGLRKWSATADGPSLIDAVKACVATGSAIGHPGVLEPRIFGTVRRGPGPKSAGGRPRAQLHHSLVNRLAGAWYRRTDRMPEPGRSDQTGFGDCVHSVFQWLGLSHAEATYALRAYWAAFRRRERERRSAASAAEE
jgi:hypothetical protein